MANQPCRPIEPPNAACVVCSQVTEMVGVEAGARTWTETSGYRKKAWIDSSTQGGVLHIILFVFLALIILAL